VFLLMRAVKTPPAVSIPRESGVTFSLDANGILSVTAFDKVTGATADTKIKADRGRLSDEDIDRMIEDAERYREEDERLAKMIHLRNAIEETVYDIKGKCVDSSDIMGIQQLDEIVEWMDDAEKFEAASYETLLEKCDWIYKKFNVSVRIADTDSTKMK